MSFVQEGDAGSSQETQKEARRPRNEPKDAGEAAV